MTYISGINQLFEKEREMKRGQKTCTLLYTFYILIIGAMLGYAWHSWQDKINSVVIEDKVSYFSDYK